MIIAATMTMKTRNKSPAEAITPPRTLPVVLSSSDVELVVEADELGLTPGTRP